MPFSVDVKELKKLYDDKGQEQAYFCPITGAHFHKADLYQRIMKLRKRRAIIDR